MTENKKSIVRIGSFFSHYYNKLTQKKHDDPPYPWTDEADLKKILEQYCPDWKFGEKQLYRLEPIDSNNLVYKDGDEFPDIESIEISGIGVEKDLAIITDQFDNNEIKEKRYYHDLRENGYKFHDAEDSKNPAFFNKTIEGYEYIPYELGKLETILKKSS